MKDWKYWKENYFLRKWPHDCFWCIIITMLIILMLWFVNKSIRYLSQIILSRVVRDWSLFHLTWGERRCTSRTDCHFITELTVVGRGEAKCNSFWESLINYNASWAIWWAHNILFVDTGSVTRSLNKNLNVMRCVIIILTVSNGFKMVVFIHLTFVKCKAQGLEEKTACEIHWNSWNRL